MRQSAAKLILSVLKGSTTIMYTVVLTVEKINNKNTNTIIKMNQQITKICTNPNCINWGNPQLLIEFSKRTYSDGRVVLRSWCKTCDCLNKKRYYKENKIKISNYNKEYNRINRDKMTILKNNWKNNNLEKYKQNQKNWNLKNQSKLLFRDSLRRSRKLNATPTWADLDKIKEIYEESSRLTRETGIQYSVDHIIPLVAKDENGNHIACGLHVETNLQVITLKENKEKSCYFLNGVFTNDIV